MEYQLSSPAFAMGERIPLRYTRDGENISPPLSWQGVPGGTQQLALIVDDPDAPSPKPFVHWVLYGLAPAVYQLDEGQPQELELEEPVALRQGENSWGKIGYDGPAPPRGHGVHHYHFTLYALSRPLDLAPGANKDTLLKAMQGAILGQATLTGWYER